MTTTVTFRGIDLRVDYDYRPEEKAVRYYSDGSGYPGCAEQLDIYKITHCKEDITDLFDQKMMEELEEVMRRREE